jgi:hypothetical protein
MVRLPPKPRTSSAEVDNLFRRHEIGKATGRLALEVEACGVSGERSGVDDEHGVSSTLAV